MLDKLDLILTIIDIILTLIDMGLIVYLFFYRFPPEKAKKPSRFTFYRRKRFHNAVPTLARNRRLP